jgi:hypothetical protein
MNMKDVINTVKIVIISFAAAGTMLRAIFLYIKPPKILNSFANPPGRLLQTFYYLLLVYLFIDLAIELASK